MSFTNDTSTQLNYTTFTNLPTYSSVTNPSILFNDGTSGIYNSTANTIIMYTSSTTALTIDSNQCLYGNGTGLTHLQYSNIDNTPTNFQSDWNSTIINKPTNFQSDYNSTVINKPTNFQSDYNSTVINTPNLSVYATNTNLNSLSSYSYLNISSTNNNLNSISSYSYLNISSTNNNLNSLSTNSILTINGHTTQITNLTTNLNSISSYSYLNISSTNNNLNNLSSYSYLNISSTNNNLNNLSSYSYLNISSTTNNLNSLSSYSYLNISSTNANLNTSLSLYLPLTGGTLSGNLIINSSLKIYNNTLLINSITPTVNIRASSESDSSILYFTTPFDGSSPYKCAIIAEGQGSYSRSKLHFCLNSDANNTFPTYNASVSSSKMSIDYNGNVNCVGAITTTGMNFPDLTYLSYPNTLYFKNTVANKIISFTDGTINVPQNINVLGYINLATTTSYITFYNKWFIFYGSANGIANSLIFNHVDTGINSYWWFNGTQTATQAEISDIRVKTDIEPLENGMEMLMKLKPKKFNILNDKNKTFQYGFISQDIEPEIPDIIYNENHYIANI